LWFEEIGDANGIGGSQGFFTGTSGATSCKRIADYAAFLFEFEERERDEVLLMTDADSVVAGDVAIL